MENQTQGVTPAVPGSGAALAVVASIVSAAQAGDYQRYSQFSGLIDEAVLVGLGAWREMRETLLTALVSYGGGTEDARAIFADLVGRGLDVNGRNDFGQTPLTIAAERFDLDTVRELLAVGADPNATAARGRTGLMYAASKYHRDAAAVASALLDAGADINRQSEEGDTALIFLARRMEVRPPEPTAQSILRQREEQAADEAAFMELLLSRGASRHLKNDEGERPFDILERRFLTEYAGDVFANAFLRLRVTSPLAE